LSDDVPCADVPSPPAPYQYLGVVFHGSPPNGVAVPTGYEVERPHGTSARPAPHEFTVGRHFDDEVDLDGPLRDLCAWVSETTERHGLGVAGFLLFARVTDDGLGFSVTVSPDVVRAIASFDVALDVSVYSE
jgi:hypothetical protein